MVNMCCAVGCTNRRKKDSNVKFSMFQADEIHQWQWSIQILEAKCAHFKSSEECRSWTKIYTKSFHNNIYIFPKHKLAWITEKPRNWPTFMSMKLFLIKTFISMQMFTKKVLVCSSCSGHPSDDPESSAHILFTFRFAPLPKLSRHVDDRYENCMKHLRWKIVSSSTS